MLFLAFAIVQFEFKNINIEERQFLVKVLCKLLRIKSVIKIQRKEKTSSFICD